MQNPYAIIKTVSFTEKSNLLTEQNSQYTFIVDIKARKPQIKAAIEQIFSRKVHSVNVLTRGGKRKRTRHGWGVRSDVKRAVVTLKNGESALELF